MSGRGINLNFSDYDQFARKNDTPQGGASAPLTYAEQTFAGRQILLLNGAIADVMAVLRDGTISSMERYREKLGELRGLECARKFIDDAQRFASDAPAEKVAPVAPLYEA